MSIEALTEEIMDEFTDALAPEWAADAAVAWAASQNVADEVGMDADQVWRAEYAERFVPTTEAEMEWCLRKREKAVHDALELSGQLTHEVEVLTRLFGKRIDKANGEAAFWTAMAERGVRSVAPDGKGKQTIRTIVGTVYVQHRKSLVWPDDDALITLGRALGIEPRVKESPDKVGIKAAVEIVDSDGELVVIDKATGEPLDAIEAVSESTVVIK